jgi:hypothetical protein
LWFCVYFRNGHKWQIKITHRTKSPKPLRYYHKTRSTHSIYSKSILILYLFYNYNHLTNIFINHSSIASSEIKGRFCPPPDLSRLINNLLPADPHSTCLALDDNQINDFSLNRHWYALNSEKLYSILKKEIRPLTDIERRDLRKWKNNDKSTTNGNTLPEFFDFANEIGKHAIERNEMLKFVYHNFYHNFYRKFKEGDFAITPKKNDQLIKFFREQFYKNIRAFQFSLDENFTSTTFPNHNPARGKSKRGCPCRFATPCCLRGVLRLRRVKFDGVHRLRFLVLTGGTLCVS